MGKLIVGKNDLVTMNPVLATEWHPVKNGKLKPSDFAYQSNKKVWWVCSKGHEWKAAINNRNAGRGCPYCSNKKVLEGYNDLASEHPGIAAEWNYAKNAPLIYCFKYMICASPINMQAVRRICFLEEYE